MRFCALTVVHIATGVPMEEHYDLTAHDDLMKDIGKAAATAKRQGDAGRGVAAIPDMDTALQSTNALYRKSDGKMGGALAQANIAKEAGGANVKSIADSKMGGALAQANKAKEAGEANVKSITENAEQMADSTEVDKLEAPDMLNTAELDNTAGGKKLSMAKKVGKVTKGVGMAPVKVVKAAGMAPVSLARQAQKVAQKKSKKVAPSGDDGETDTVGSGNGEEDLIEQAKIMQQMEDLKFAASSGRSGIQRPQRAGPGHEVTGVKDTGNTLESLARELKADMVEAAGFRDKRSGESIDLEVRIKGAKDLMGRAKITNISTWHNVSVFQKREMMYNTMHNQNEQANFSMGGPNMSTLMSNKLR